MKDLKLMRSQTSRTKMRLCYAQTCKRNVERNYTHNWDNGHTRKKNNRRRVDAFVFVQSCAYEWRNEKKKLMQRMQTAQCTLHAHMHQLLESNEYDALNSSRFFFSSTSSFFDSQLIATNNWITKICAPFSFDCSDMSLLYDFYFSTDFIFVFRKYCVFAPYHWTLTVRL